MLSYAPISWKGESAISSHVKCTELYRVHAEYTSKMIKKKSNRTEGFCKKGALLKNFGKFTGKHLCPSLFFNKVAGLWKKKTLAQVFSCEFCKISKNTFSYRTAPVAGSLNGSWFCKQPITYQFLQILTHFMPVVPLYTPWNHQKTKTFLNFSWGIESSDQWYKIGS